MSDLKQELSSLQIDRERPVRSPWRWPLLLFVPALLGLGLLYVLRIRASLSAPEVETVRASVTAGPESAVAGTPILTASGYVVPRRKAVVSAKIQGRLAKLNVEEGSRVGEGEVIARLESADFEAQVERARAQVLRAEAELAETRRQLRVAERLAGEKVLAVDELESAGSRVKMAEAALAQATADLTLNQALLENTRIRAPFSGTVLKKMAEVGESVAPIPPGVNLSTSSGAIVALADLDTLEVEADVAQQNIARLTADQPAEVAVDAFPDRRYRAVLRQVIPTADRTKATVQVKVTIVDKDRNLKPEMSATVTFLEPDRRAANGPSPGAAVRQVSVPREAVVTRDGKSVVFEVRDGRARQRPVVTGAERQGRLLITDGLTGSETLVARPSEALRDGHAVRTKG